jgi:LPXTG-motif cell wall-anchored protein
MPCFNSRWSFTFIMTMLIVILLTALPVFAGEGDGSGGGQGEPLRMDSSSPYNGQKDVPLPLVISMTFNKNVVNMTVSDNNLKCFSLYAADGSAIPIDVIMADDQIEPEKKRNIVLKPLQDLKHNTAYTVKVSSALKSKSGNIMGGDLTITFITAKDSTVAGPAVSDNAAPQNTGGALPVGTVEPQAAQAAQVENSAAAGTAGASSTGSSLAASTSSNANAGSGSDNPAGESSRQGDAGKPAQPGGGQGTGSVTWVVVIAGLALVAAAGYIISRRKK